MTYISIINNQPYRVTPGPPDRHGHPTSITLDDRSIELDWQKIANIPADIIGKGSGSRDGGRYSLILNGRSYEVIACPLPPIPGREGQGYEIFLNGQRFEIFVEDERSQLLAGLAQSSHIQSTTAVRAPMPGRVLNVLVEAGETVSPNQTVAILEAMKMENDLVTPVGGIVQEVRVSKGQTVDKNDILAIIDSGTIT